MEEAAASFSTEIFSISCGLIAFISPSIPSMSTNGSTFEPAPIVPTPRILNFLSEPREPPPSPVEIFIPGTIPCKASMVELTGRAEISFAPTVDTAPVTFTFFCVPKATTTTSSNVCVLSLRMTFNDCPANLIS